jgi:hypothetical protein
VNCVDAAAVEGDIIAVEGLVLDVWLVVFSSGNVIIFKALELSATSVQTYVFDHMKAGMSRQARYHRRCRQHFKVQLRTISFSRQDHGTLSTQ